MAHAEQAVGDDRNGDFCLLGGLGPAVGKHVSWQETTRYGGRMSVLADI
jgi:hypothetical protein